MKSIYFIEIYVARIYTLANKEIGSKSLAAGLRGRADHPGELAVPQRTITRRQRNNWGVRLDSLGGLGLELVALVGEAPGPVALVEASGAEGESGGSEEEESGNVHAMFCWLVGKGLRGVPFIVYSKAGKGIVWMFPIRKDGVIGDIFFTIKRKKGKIADKTFCTLKILII